MTDQPDDLSQLARVEYCYVTTTGRVTGSPHRIEIWFGMREKTLYLLSGDGKSDWVKNMRVQPGVSVQIGENVFTARARMVSDGQEDALARRLLAGKYQGWREGRPLSEWARSALPVAMDLLIESGGLASP